MKFKIFIGILFSFLLSESAFSQQRSARKDTAHIYDNIESYSQRNRITKYLYGLIFEPHLTNPVKKEVSQKVYSNFEGKVIRKINIETLDPFGYSIADTLLSPKNIFLRAGNEWHLKTKNITIRNLLLLNKNQRFDSLLVKESERLVRSQDFVRDVSFSARPTSEMSDSVDINIRVLDNWSLIPNFSTSPSSNIMNLTEQNFIGSGHEVRVGYTKDMTGGPNSFSTNYYVPNIRNTYISSTLHYEFDNENNHLKSVAIDRPFYSSLARWAGGVSFACQSKKANLMGDDSIYAPINLEFQTQDFWGGYAYQLFKGNTEDERTTNLITTARYLRVHYLENPSETYDPLRNYSNENFLLFGVGLSSRKYVQDKYVFKYGVPEDIPIGRVYALTGGYQIKHDCGRLFLGARFSVGNYYPWGYLSSNFKYESFFHSSKSEEGVFVADIKYFTKLLEIGNWRFRQFLEPKLTIGINRLSCDSLTLNDGFGIKGFESNNLSGTRRIMFTSQTQAYAPWDLIGFRFGPFFTYSLGMLGDAETGFKHKRLCSNIGLGILIMNEHLILNTFQLSISFYPIIPGDGHNVYKTNSLETTDFGLSNFEIGKPAPTVFQ